MTTTTNDNLLTFEGFPSHWGDLVTFRGIMTKGYYLARHSQTAENADHIARGWADPPVDKAGKKQAKIQAKWFVGKGLVAIETSDMERAQYSARKIEKATGAPITEVNRTLRSWNLGDFEGRPEKDVDPLIEAYARHKPDTVLPGSDESFDTFKKRVLGCAQKVMRSYEQGDVGPIVQVTHSRFIRMVAAYVKAGCMNDDTIDIDTFFRFKIPDAGAMQLSMDDLGRWRLRVWDVQQEKASE